MIKHIAMWKLRLAEGQDRDTVFSIIQSALAAQVGRIPGLLESEAGLNFKVSSKAMDVVVYTVFTDREALEAYHRHPAHMETRAAVDGFLEQGCMADYEVAMPG